MKNLLLLVDGWIIIGGVIAANAGFTAGGTLGTIGALLSLAAAGIATFLIYKKIKDE